MGIEGEAPSEPLRANQTLQEFRSSGVILNEAFASRSFFLECHKNYMALNSVTPELLQLLSSDLQDTCWATRSQVKLSS